MTFVLSIFEWPLTTVFLKLRLFELRYLEVNEKSIIIRFILSDSLPGSDADTYDGKLDSKGFGRLGPRVSLTKRSSAYKRLPGWKVYYGKRSSDSNIPRNPEAYNAIDTEGLNELLKQTNRFQNGDTEPDETKDTDDSVVLNSADYKSSDIDNLEQELPSQLGYKINSPFSPEDHVAQYSNLRFLSDVGVYRNEQNDGIRESKRSGWNAVYGKRMPGWFATYGKRGQYINGANDKRAPGWIATYGKRDLSSLQAYEKRAPQWIATYGKRAPQWFATYGKRAPRWFATYGKRTPGWLSTYGKRSGTGYLNQGILDILDSHKYNSNTNKLSRQQTQKLFPNWNTGYENSELH